MSANVFRNICLVAIVFYFNFCLNKSFSQDSNSDSNSEFSKISTQVNTDIGFRSSTAIEEE